MYELASVRFPLNEHVCAWFLLAGDDRKCDSHSWL